MKTLRLVVSERNYAVSLLCSDRVAFSKFSGKIILEIECMSDLVHLEVIQET